MKSPLIPGLLALALSWVSSSAPAALVIKVDKSTQTLTVKRDGETLHTWPVSTGKPGHATPSGSFTTFRMEAEHFSKEWDDAPMPHSIFFSKQGHAIHGSYDVKRLGSPASHGCVRLAPSNAAKLFALVKQQGLSNTQVILSGSEQIALAHGKGQWTVTTTRLSRVGESMVGRRDNEPMGSGALPPPLSLQSLSEEAYRPLDFGQPR
jgi:hypothetical protein